MVKIFVVGFLCGALCASFGWWITRRREREELGKLLSATADLDQAVTDQQKIDQQETKE